MQNLQCVCSGNRLREATAANSKKHHSASLKSLVVFAPNTVEHVDLLDGRDATVLSVFLPWPSCLVLTNSKLGLLHTAAEDNPSAAVDFTANVVGAVDLFTAK